MAGIVYLRILATDGVLISLSTGDTAVDDVKCRDVEDTVSSDTAAAFAVSIDATVASAVAASTSCFSSLFCTSFPPTSSSLSSSSSSRIQCKVPSSLCPICSTCFMMICRVKSKSSSCERLKSCCCVLISFVPSSLYLFLSSPVLNSTALLSSMVRSDASSTGETDAADSITSVIPIVASKTKAGSNRSGDESTCLNCCCVAVSFAGLNGDSFISESSTDDEIDVVVFIGALPRLK
mmetsp:Transcript_879/g.1354  ORF Transcript_879/g.1354 Transcript_879/m.1354 type:complete len:236 (+) Transcript_879:124-831(+)